MGFVDADEGNVGAAEELFHIFRVVARGFVFVGAVVELDGADGAQGTFVTEDEIDGFVVDEAIGFVAILEADFMTEKGRKVDARDDVEFLAKKFVEELETLFFDANHEVLARAVATAVHDFAIAATGGNSSENRDQKQRQGRDDGDGDINPIRPK